MAHQETTTMPIMSVCGQSTSSKSAIERKEKCLIYFSNFIFFSACLFIVVTHTNHGATKLQLRGMTSVFSKNQPLLLFRLHLKAAQCKQFSPGGVAESSSQSKPC